jgi:hypothetical protein
MATTVLPPTIEGEEAAPRGLTAAEIKNSQTPGGNAAFHNFHNDFAHVVDLNERRRLALAEIDKAPFGWYHVRAIIVAGIGFFTDSVRLNYYFLWGDEPIARPPPVAVAAR